MAKTSPLTTEEESDFDYQIFCRTFSAINFQLFPTSLSSTELELSKIHAKVRRRAYKPLRSEASIEQ